MKIPLIDLHEDISYYFLTHTDFRDFRLRDKSRPCDIPSYQEINLKIVVGVIFPMTPGISMYTSEIQKMYGRDKNHRISSAIPLSVDSSFMSQLRFYYRLEESYEDITMIRDKKDIDRVFKNNRIGLLIGLEGSEALCEPGDVSFMYRLGVRLIGLTWNYDTRYAASCMSSKDYGLTGSGKKLVEYMNEYGIIIDLAHSSYNTMFEVLSISKLPVIDSHTNYNGVRKHKRNIGDDIIEMLVRNRGVMGFTLIKSTISDGDYLDNLAKHIYSVYSRFGSEVLAIGTDLFGTEPPYPLTRIDTLTRLYEKLLDMGMREIDIEKLSWKNAYRVIIENSKNWR